MLVVAFLVVVVVVAVSASDFFPLNQWPSVKQDVARLSCKKSSMS